MSDQQLKGVAMIGGAPLLEYCAIPTLTLLKCSKDRVSYECFIPLDSNGTEPYISKWGSSDHRIIHGPSLSTSLGAINHSAKDPLPSSEENTDVHSSENVLELSSRCVTVPENTPEGETP
ncbi:hypothetical protein TNCV_3158731 [Trichonephila clavipes]|nr:hypothetical protein TNCV_3158731 [Trichonephila clavipes]